MCMDEVKKIRTMMEERGWTQKQLAEKANLPYSTINSMFRKDTSLSIATLKAIVNAFSLSMSDFYAEEETVAGNTFTERECGHIQKMAQLPANISSLIFLLVENL